MPTSTPLSSGSSNAPAHRGRTAIEIDITRNDSWLRGRYEARIPGKDAAGELTYRKQGVDVVVAEHTGVPETLRGNGIATALVERLVADAKEEGFRIVPRCPFVRALFEKNPDWAPVMAAGR